MADISPQGHAPLQALWTVRRFETGEIVVREGAADPFLYILCSGSVRVEKSTSDGQGAHTLNVLGPGESLGEMTLVTPGPAPASVIALSPVALCCLDLQRLRDEPDDSGLREVLLRNIARVLSHRLRDASAKTADAMQAEIRQGLLRESAGHFIVYMFVVMSAFAFFVAGLQALGPHLPRQALLSAFVIIGASVPVAVLLRKSPYPATTYGLTLYRWRRVAVEAVFYTLPILGLLTLVKLGWMLASPEHWAQGLFHPFASLKDRREPGPWLGLVTAYSVLSGLQEFFARSGLQASIQLFDGQHAAGRTHWRAIVIANLMFASAHTYLGLRFMVAAFVPGLFWGWLFDRQRSLVGVAVSHALVGIFALFVLGLQVVVGGR